MGNLLENIGLSPVPEIKEWIQKYFASDYGCRIQPERLIVTPDPETEDDYYVVDYPGNVQLDSITASIVGVWALTNGKFRWRSVGDFDLCGYYGTSLEGAPSLVRGNFYCCNCYNLTSLEGGPKEVQGLYRVSNCNKITSLQGIGDKLLGDVLIGWNDELKSLKGCPQTIKKRLTLEYLPKIISLEGGPKEVGELSVNHCENLKDRSQISLIHKTKRHGKFAS